MLKSASGNILDDEVLIQHLDSAKLTSEEVTRQLKQAEETSTKIDAAREQYRKVAARGCVMYRAVDDMSGMNPMYQNSLDKFRMLFQVKPQ